MGKKIKFKKKVIKKGNSSFIFLLLHETDESIINSFLDLLSSFSKKGNRSSFIYRVSGEREFFIKSYTSPCFFNGIKNIFYPPRGIKEFFLLSSLKNKRDFIISPTMLIIRKRMKLPFDYWIVFPFAKDTITFSDFLKVSNVKQKRDALLSLIMIVKSMHDMGIFHADLHPENFLIDLNNNERLYIVDFHRAKIKDKLNDNLRLKDIARLAISIEEYLNLYELAHMVSAYYGKKIDNQLKQLLLMIKREKEILLKRHLKRFLSPKYGVNFLRENKWRFFYLDNISVGDVRNWIEKEPENLIKDDKKTKIYLKSNGKDVCIKRFKLIGFFRFFKMILNSRAKKNWFNGWGLIKRGVNAPSPLAFGEKGKLLSKESIFIMEDLSHFPKLDHYIAKKFQSKGFTLKEKRDFVKSFAFFMKKLIFCLDIYHADLKTCNILVEEKKEGDWKFWLLDFDRIRFGKKVSKRRVIKNLVQLNNSTPRVFSLTNRIRFIKYMIKEKTYLKEIFQKVKKISIEKPIIYTSPKGDVIERW